MKNIRLFDNDLEYYNATLDYPNVAYISSIDKVIMKDTDPSTEKSEYLNFKAVGGDATIEMPNSGQTYFGLSYSFDKNTWTNWNYSAITIPNGSTVYFKGDNPNGMNKGQYSGFRCFKMTGKVEAHGNIQSLLWNDDFENNLTIPKDYCFFGLFSGCTSLTSAPQLPATTLTQYCYQYMFRNCTSLTTAPQLPATTITQGCYSNMFNGCTSLTTAPALPATTMVSSCYEGMFRNCTSLKYAPSLPAMVSAMYCYRNMFNGCTSLTIAPELPITTLTGNYCYGYMFAGCTSLTSAPQLPATTLTDLCYDNMFNGCTSLTSAPELPATTLAQQCYGQMFENCSNLNYVKAMFTSTPSTDRWSGQVYNWLNGVASSGTFVKNSEATWTTSGVIPNGWTVQTASE